MQIHIRIFAPTYLTHAPPPSPPKKNPFRDSPKQHSHFVHHFPLNRNKYLRYSISDTTNQSSQPSRSKLNINSCRFLCWPSVKGRGDGRQKHLGHAMAGALKEPSLSLACSSNLWANCKSILLYSSGPNHTE